MFKFIAKHFFKKSKIVRQKPPKYRLVPDEHGTYILERFEYDVGFCLCKAVNIKSPEQADEVIAHLERGVIYYREK